FRPRRATREQSGWTTPKGIQIADSKCRFTEVGRFRSSLLLTAFTGLAPLEAGRPATAARFSTTRFVESGSTAFAQIHRGPVECGVTGSTPIFLPAPIGKPPTNRRYG